LPENVPGLIADTFALRAISDDTGEIDGIAMHYGLAHARPYIVTFDTHASPHRIY